jgi:GTPase Era involved in 16S rRNA processing
MAETMSKHPKFAVVGHPNKGKSSIVSALAMDDSVQVSDTPGTTTKQRSFPLKVDGKILYELFDTPGFQRARRVLAWLEKHEVSADKKHEVVRAFIHEHRDDARFNDEVQLLEPIMAGAGIIYVVDGSKPYGKEYEAEMEVLRWTGQPSMALINHIDDYDYSQEWKRALEQYFKMVRTFNPMETSLTQHMSILESMAQLKEEWIAPIKASMKLFDTYHKQMMERSASFIAQLVYRSTSLVDKLSFSTEDASEKDKENIEENYKNKLRVEEHNAQENIEQIWNHDRLDISQENLTFEDLDLFSQESASVFGLTQKELIVTGATSGAVTGAGIDLLFVGHTLLLGSVVGAVVGGVGAYFGFKELAEVKVLGHTLGNKYLQMGPMENRNFPYILLGRALFHTLKVSKRSHAKRGDMELMMDSSFKDLWLDDDVRKSLEKYHKIFRSDKEVSSEVMKEYEVVLRGVLESLIHT